MNDEAKNEKRDVDVTAIFGIVALVAVIAVATAIATGGLFRAFMQHRDATDPLPPAIASERANFPAPRLQTAPADDLAKLRAREDAELTSYAWIDRERGVVRLPIRRAIDLLSERGLPEVGAGMTELQFMQNVPVQNEHRQP